MKRATLFLLLLTSLTAQAFEIRLRNSENGQSLHGTVELESLSGRVYRQEIQGENRLQLDEAIVRIRAQAKGFQPMELERTFTTDARLTLQLDPLPGKQKDPRPKMNPGEMGLEIHVLDAHSAKPVAGARLVLQNAEALNYGQKSPTGNLLYRWPLPKTKIADEQMWWMEIHAPGYVSQRLAFFPAAGWLKQIVYLQSGTGLEVKEPQERLSRFPWKNQDNPPLQQPDVSKAAKATLLPPPANITVGFADANCNQPCNGSACVNSCTYSLETYVKRGLNDEWISSWNDHSLKAGSIAYRSYGAWYVYNPKSSNFDICSNTCCQVNDPDTSSATNAAADATAGMMLTYGSQPARSEFSAENNSWNDPNDGLSCTNSDLSCGDGYVGSPAANWPCLADSVASGRGCFGHGRGLSQWGSQRWTYNSNGNKLFNWILNHYYNGNGNPGGLRSAYISSPIEIHGLQLSNSQVLTGESLQLNLDLSNLAAGDHNHLLIGASLYSANTGYLDDPSNDTLFTLPANTRDIRSRVFDLSTQNVPAGQYDVVVAVWLDTDEDGQITSLDEPLQTWRE